MTTRILLCFGFVLLAIGSARAEDKFEDLLRRQNAELETREREATELLVKTRERIVKERTPLLEQLRQVENEILAAEADARRLESDQEHANEKRRNLLKEIDSLARSRNYVTTLAQEGLKAVVEGAAPGEAQIFGEKARALQQKLETTTTAPNAETAAETVEFLLDRAQRLVGGYAAAGSAISAENNRVYRGTYAFAGPETYFLTEDGQHAGVVRMREGGELPTLHPIAMWNPADAAAYFSGSGGAMIADPSGGKALKLEQTKGSLWAHIRKGGVVAYAILAVGLVALMMIVQKAIDAGRVGIDPPETVRVFLEVVANGEFQSAERALPKLKRRTAQLFSVGLAHRRDSKTLLEEHLQSVLLEQRLHLERRLPLLAVIATAAPLMGLLGTVVGMVRTFALITVFGTGNAGKLSSGISEVLVATELGLCVAIPTLVAHGFLAHRIQKMMTLQERYALQFVIAVETAQVGGTDRVVVNAGVK